MMYPAGNTIRPAGYTGDGAGHEERSGLATVRFPGWNARNPGLLS
jgi:hypothetical protein